MSEEDIDRLRVEGIVPLKSLARQFNVHHATLTRWILNGGRMRDGQRVHLEAVRTPGRWLTSAQAVTRFLEAMSGRPESSEPAVRTPGERNRAADAATLELAAMGI